jgi:DNA repair protein SbcC/Rad50
MFGNAFKKDEVPPHTAGAQPSPGSSETDLQAWREKIIAAEGDEGALLELAKQAPGVDLKLAVVAALTQEDALKQAMREFRDQDKRLYRAAKARWQEAVERREAAAEAPLLIAAARGLLGQETVPANRLVELDRAWEALNATLLDDALVSEFAEARAQLVAKVRHYGEGEQAIARWLATADASIHALTAGLPAVAQGAAAPAAPELSGGPAARAAALLQLLDEVPGASGAAIDARCIEKTDAARRALALASSVVQRAEFLQSLPPAGVADEADEKAKIEQWRGFPEVADETLQALLAHRFSAWRNAGSEKRQRDDEARRAHERETSAEERRRRLAAIERHVESADAAQAGGHVDELTRLMALIDEALKRSPVNAALTKRIESLRQEQIRLRDWQRWSGAQRREELVAEAQALAAEAGGKVALKAHAEAIDKLRERWKELDKLGGATSKPLWLAFDGALKAAYVPVSAHLDKLKAARNENLAARNQVIEGLVKAAGNPPDRRATARLLGEAKIAWRKLGPIEHTVPRQAQKGDGAVTARYAAAVQALEAPLSQAYSDAAREREQLVAAAKTLGESKPLARDAIDKVRALQAQWQAHAKALPLPRREENALWSAFKAATDAVFTARDAARAARDAEAGERNKARVERDAARTAREAETARLRDAVAHAAQARFDGLIEAMRLCDEREAAGEVTPDLEARWNALQNLPKAWKPAMEARFRGASPKGDLPGALLRLEVACGIDSPGEFAAARQQLKLLALKNALESRRGAAAAPPDIERDLLAAAAMPGPDEMSRSRLAKIIAAVRVRRPGAS